MKITVPSSTANVVARNLAIIAATKETKHLVPEKAAQLNALFVEEFSSGGAQFLKKARRRWFQKLFRFYERLTIPGLALHHALRKILIERVVRESILQGFKQIVVLGGGLDPLALRLQLEFPHVNWIELDHPATQQIKRETIEKAGLGGENLKLIAIDFSNQTLEETLKNTKAYQPQLETVFICEGILMYLEQSQVKQIFDFIGEPQESRKRFIFTFMEPDESGKTNFRNPTFLVQLWLNWKNEPFRWSINQNELNRFLTERNFSFKKLATAATLRRTYLRDCGLANEALAEGENICSCDAIKSE